MRIDVAVETLLRMTIDEGREQGDEMHFLAATAHALWSFELKRANFLERHRKVPAVKYFLKTTLRLIFKLTEDEGLRRKIMLKYVAAVSAAYEDRTEAAALARDEKIKLRALPGRMLKKAISRM